MRGCTTQPREKKEICVQIKFAKCVCVQVFDDLNKEIEDDISKGSRLVDKRGREIALCADLHAECKREVVALLLASRGE